jgi:hypothetical protein
LQTGSMWQVIDNDTIVVAPDSPSVRVDLLPQTMKTINLKNVQSTGITEIVIALRTILNVRQISTLADAIVMQDTAENIALAERIVSDLDKPASR